MERNFVWLVFVVVLMVLGWASPSSPGSDVIGLPIVGITTIVLAGEVLRAYEWERIGQFAIELGRCWGGMLALYVGTVWATPFGLDTADRFLSLPERWTGFGSVQLASMLHELGLAPAAAFLYDRSVLIMLAVVHGLLAYRREFQRMEAVADTFVVCALIGLVSYVFFPAVGPVTYLAPKTSTLPWFQDWLEMRAGLPVTVHGSLCGYVAFPSFHAVLITLITIAAGSTPLRWPAFAWGGASILVTIAVGQHYLLDVVFGIALAMASWRVCADWRHRDDDPR